MQIKILGGGCPDCHTLERHTREALAELGMTAEVIAVTDHATIAGYGVMTPPALVIDERVVLSGRVASTAQVAKLLAAAGGPVTPATGDTRHR